MHQIHFDASYQQKCTAEDNIVRLRSGFQALFGNTSIAVSTLSAFVWHVGMRVCYSLSYRLWYFISVCKRLNDKEFVCFPKVA